MERYQSGRWLQPFWRALAAGKADNSAELLAACPTGKERERALQYALHRAASLGRYDIVEHVLRRQGDPNGRDACGRTPLHRAAAAGHAQVLSLLLEYGARIDARDMLFGMTALHLAARHRHTDAVICLLSRGADAELRDRFGETPGSIARRVGDQDLVMVLRFPEMVRQRKRRKSALPASMDRYVSRAVADK